MRYSRLIFIFLIFASVFFTPHAGYAQSNNGTCYDNDRGVPEGPVDLVTYPGTGCPAGQSAAKGGVGGVTVPNNLSYTPLEPLSSSGGPPQNFCDLINLLFRVFIYLGAMVAVLWLVLGGINYMVSEVVNKRSAAKKRIEAAIYGLLILLGSYLILNTVNPTLVGVCTILAPTGSGVYFPPPTSSNVTIRNGTFTTADNNSALIDNQVRGSAGQTLESLRAANASYQQLQSFCISNGGALAPVGIGEVPTGCAGDLPTHDYGGKIYGKCGSIPTPSGSFQLCYYNQQ